VRGFSLVEVVLALGVVSFCLVALMGILPVGFVQEKKSTDQLLNLQVLSAVATDFQSAASGTTNTTRYGISIPAVGSLVSTGTLGLDQTFSPVASGTTPQFLVSYTLQSPASKFSSYRLVLRVVRTSQRNVFNNLDNFGVDYLESVVLKPLI
jgi:uncharacterized protein (TIGR02598 family)